MSDQESKSLKVDQKYVDIVKSGFENGLDSDAIQVELVKAGLKFKAAASTFKKVSEHLGFKTNAKDRLEKAKELLGDFKPADWGQVQKAAAHLVENITDTTESQAIQVLRRICKDAEVEFPKKPKASGGGDGAPRGFKAEAFNWILANKDCTKEQLAQFIKDNEKPTVYVSRFWMIVELCRDYAKQD